MAVMVIDENQGLTGHVDGGRKISARDVFFWAGVATVVGILAVLLVKYGGQGPTGAFVDALALAFGVTLIIACLLAPYFMVRGWRAWRAKKNIDEYEVRYSEMVSQQKFSEATSEIDLDSELDFEFQESDTSSPLDSLSLFDDDSVLFADEVKNEMDSEEEESEFTVEFVTEFASEALDEVPTEEPVGGFDLLAEGPDLPNEDSDFLNEDSSFSVEASESLAEGSSFTAEDSGFTAEGSDHSAEGSELLAEDSELSSDSSFDEPISQYAGDIETQTEFINNELERGFEDSTPGTAELESLKQQLDDTLDEIQAVPKSGDPVRDLEAHEFDLVCLRYIAAIGYKTPTRCKGIHDQFEFAIQEPDSSEPYALVRCIPEPCVIEAEFLADVNLSMLKAGATCGILFTRFPVDPITIKAASAWDFEIIDSEELNQRLEALPAEALSRVVPAAPMESSAVTLDSLDISNIESHPSFEQVSPLDYSANFQQPAPTLIQDFLNEAS